ncbi:uncharacterized protein [Mobula birostris]|uniref:uncharacterized protein isoform X2 n=2 Tax=Mobula birostris TaxID=1983395 RepID=UPI003B285B9E
MNTFIFIICVSFIFFLPGRMSQNDRKPEVVLTNGSMQTVLPCSIPNAEQVVWEFKPASGDQRTEICKIDKGNEQCDSTLFPNIKLVDLHELRRGNYSLQLVANNTDVGTYYCKSNSSSVQEKEIRLISFKVSATPENAILEGATVQLMLESSDISYFHNMTWSVPSNSVTGKGIEISWSLNNEKIIKNSRFEFDYRSLNISRFRSNDTGRYVYTVKRSKGSSAFYSISIQKAGATTSQATTSTTSLSTAGATTSQATTSTTSLSTAGATTSQATTSTTSLSTAGATTSQATTSTTSLSTAGATTSQATTSTTTLSTAGTWIATFLFGTLGIMIIIILLCIIIKKKCTSPGDPDTVQAATVDSEVPYATINLAALNKAEPSAPVTTENALYAEVKTQQAEPTTNEMSV